MKPHNTEQAARGLLMYELAIRGYTIQFTDSRFPLEDLLCISPKGKHFGIDVKGQKTKNFWRIKEPNINPELFYAFAYVAPRDLARIFIMDSATVKKYCCDYKARINFRNEKPENYPWGLNWGTVRRFEERYDLLPE